MATSKTPTLVQTAIVDAAIRAGKITTARRDHYLALMVKDEAGTTALLESFAAVLDTATGDRAVADDPDPGFFAVLASLGLKPELAARIAAAPSPVRAVAASQSTLPRAASKPGDVGDPVTFAEVMRGFGVRP